MTALAFCVKIIIMTSVDKNEIQRLKRERLYSRITEIDVIRGICVILMVFDHFMYDIFDLMPSVFVGFPKEGFWRDFVILARKYWLWDVRTGVRSVVVFLFLALTGISCSFSKSNLKRGLMLLVIALGVTGVTVGVGIATDNMNNLITFGILHLISLSIITVSIVERFTQNKWVYLAIGALMLVIGAIVLNENNYCFFGEESLFLIFLKQFTGVGMFGADSYSFLYYGGQIYVGVFLGKLLYSDKKSLIFKKGYSNDPLTFIGRHSLLVYVVHQILIPVVLVIILLLQGYTFAI